VRIVLVNKFAYPTGGADIHCLRLAARLRDRGNDVLLLSTASSENRDANGRFVRCTVTNSTRDALALRAQLAVAGRAVWNQEAYDAMSTLIQEFRPDVVHAHKLYPQLSVAPVVAAARAGVPIVQTVHDYEFVAASPFDHVGGRWDSHESRAAYRLLNSCLFLIKRHLHVPRIWRWIAVSRFVADRLALGGVVAEAIPNFANATSGLAGVERDAREGIVYVGKLSAEKGIQHVLELARLLPDVPVVIAGDGPARLPVVEAATALENLRYLGRVEPAEVIKAFARARIAVIPSLWEEPGASTAVEAMSVGTPLVVYRAGGIAEYVRDAEAGLIVDQGPDRLAEACSGLLSDSARWPGCSEAGLTAAAGPHNIDTYCDRLEEIYAVVARPSASKRASK
jgi:glycosyltransferase involved in cell wall biosynthesis